MTYWLITEMLPSQERDEFDRMLVETPDDREQREVAPLLAAMGGPLRGRHR